MYRRTVTDDRDIQTRLQYVRDAGSGKTATEIRE